MQLPAWHTPLPEPTSHDDPSSEIELTGTPFAHSSSVQGSSSSRTSELSLMYVGWPLRHVARRQSPSFSLTAGPSGPSSKAHTLLSPHLPMVQGFSEMQSALAVQGM